MIKLPWCDVCVHYLGGDRCSAFPQLIPDRFSLLGIKHVKVEAGQIGKDVFKVATNSSTEPLRDLVEQDSQ